MTSADHLLRKTKLYDVESMMNLEKSVANGFVILLKGGEPSRGSKKKKSEKKNDNGSDALAFLALTSGNVIDACFGVINPNIRKESPARRSAQEAKVLLEECDTTDSFRQTAVDAYGDAFEVIITYNDRMNKLNCLTRCFRSREIRRQTEEKIHTAFASLLKAVEESR